MRKEVYKREIQLDTSDGEGEGSVAFKIKDIVVVVLV
jgi:hypothetical protein